MYAQNRRAVPKYQQVLEKLQRAIVTGTYKSGQKLPSEAALTQQFDTSRITVGRALHELQQRGIVERRAGSGTYVAPEHAAKELLFGLLIPDLGQTDIFEPICQGMSRAPNAGGHALLWGNTTVAAGTSAEQVWQLCRQYITRKVGGVFFAPLEFAPQKDEVNHRIAEALEKAGIPIVLLDRGILPYPQRGRHDLVGIDNRRAGYLITDHLARLGVRRIAFVAYPGAASTVEARIAGFREALFVHGIPVDQAMVWRLDPAYGNEVRQFMETGQAEAFVCANDRTAGKLMQTLLELGYKIPQDVRIAGIDDVEYASLLPVPLTTIRQPCQQIGEVAISTMLQRIAHPGAPTRDVLLDCTLVVRQSCGTV